MGKGKRIKSNRGLANMPHTNFETLQEEADFVCTMAQDKLFKKWESMLMEQITFENNKELEQMVKNTNKRNYDKFMAIASNVLLNKWGLLVKKSTRLKVFNECFEKLYEEFANPTEQQINAEKELVKQIGRKMQIRKE